MTQAGVRAAATPDAVYVESLNDILNRAGSISGEGSVMLDDE